MCGVCMFMHGFSILLPQTKDMQARLNGDSKLPIDVNVNESGIEDE